MGLGTTLKIAFDAKKVQRGLARLGTSIGNMGKRLARVGFATVTASIAALTAGIGFFIKSSSESAAEIESMTSAFTVLTGSAEKAAGILEEIRKFGAETPLEQKDLQKSAQTLLAFGVALEDVMPTLKMLGDISSGNAEKLGSLALVFGQVSSAGKLTGGDLLQFVNVGFNPLNEIAKRTGKSMGELRDMMSKGQITTAMVKQAFEDATGAGGMFNGMLAKMAATTQGKLSNLSDNIEQLKVSFGKGFNDGLKVALDAVNNWLPQVMGKFKSFGELLGNAISDSVNGNFDKFAAIGKLIGDVVGAAASAAFQAGAPELWKTMMKGLEDINPIRRGLEAVGVDAGRGSQWETAGFKELFGAQAVNRGIQQQAQNIAAGTQGLVPGTNGRFQYAPAGDYSSPFTDAKGNRVVEVLNRIEKNTQAGAKM